PMDAHQWADFFPHVATSPRLSKLVRRARAKRGVADRALLTALRAAEATERVTMLERFLREQVGHVLRLDPARIERQTPFQSLGIDSVMGLELRNRIEASLGITLPATLIWTYPNVVAMAKYLAEKLGTEQSASSAQVKTTRTREVVTASADNA